MKNQIKNILNVAAGVLKCLCVVGFLVSAAHACDDTTILIVSGKISYKNSETGVYCFSFKELSSLQRKKITTRTVWTDRSDFEGPPILDLLKVVGAFGTKVKVMAENDYSHTISIDNFKKYNPILAYLQNRKRLVISDFGPLFLIYPRDDFPEELSLPTARAKFVWNVYRLDVR